MIPTFVSGTNLSRACTASDIIAEMLIDPANEESALSGTGGLGRGSWLALSIG
jgi:hypothetical protein